MKKKRVERRSYKYVAYLALVSEILATTSEFCQARRRNTSWHLLQEPESDLHYGLSVGMQSKPPVDGEYLH